jgi:hypothetical protein
MANPTELEGLVMAMLVPTAKTESAHYYLKTGENCHGTLREARKVGAFPSVTTILGATLARPGLENWKVAKGIESSLTLPRRENELDADFVKRVVHDMGIETSAAAEKGTAVHALAEQVMAKQPRPQLSSEMLPFWFALEKWRDEKITKVYNQEFVVVNEQDGYAGRCDMTAEHKDYGTVIVDFKTRGRSKPVGKKTVGIIPTREGDILQLGAYRHGTFADEEASDVVCLSVLIDNQTGEITEHAWTCAEAVKGYEVFCHLVAVWCWLKKYDPREVAV